MIACDNSLQVITLYLFRNQGTFYQSLNLVDYHLQKQMKVMDHLFGTCSINM